MSLFFSERLRGTITEVHFENCDSGWAVIGLDIEAGGHATVVGILAPIFVGETIEVEGAWESNYRFGRQFQATSLQHIRPHDCAAVERYLASGAVPGIGRALAHRLVEKFGDKTLHVLDEEPVRLLEVRGIGAKRVAEIRRVWESRAVDRAARIFLQGHGLGPAMTGRIVRAWKEQTIARVEKNPFALAIEFYGIGFRTADAVASSLGWEADSPQRLRAGIVHALRTAAEQGHCFAPYKELAIQARQLLGLPDELPVRRIMDEMIAAGDLVQEALDDRELGSLPPTQEREGQQQAVYLNGLHAAELRVATRLILLHTSAAAVSVSKGENEELRADPVAWVEESLGVPLGDDQRAGLREALEHNVAIITGGPGTGKTTLVDAMVRCFSAVGARVCLAAPTGRASKRLEQATGHHASTIHRFLEYSVRHGFARGLMDPVDADVAIVDESSMIDLSLMDALVAALPIGARLVLVGDADQLPSVGPGAVLRDLIASGRLPVIHLSVIYRQAQDSLIVRNAHRVNTGNLPLDLLDTAADVESDFYTVGVTNAERAREVILEMVKARIPARFGLDPMQDIQVLVPMHRGECGVRRLNEVLQAALNPAGAELASGDTLFRVGDRVIQLRNDYEREVFNGDVGQIVAIQHENGIKVMFDGRQVNYDKRSLGNLALAYAISIHKSQGSEYPAVIVVLLPEHHIMLQRNLLYTALTRAQRLAILVGSTSTVRKAVTNDSPSARFTRLAWRLGQVMQSAVGGQRS